MPPLQVHVEPLVLGHCDGPVGAALPRMLTVEFQLRVRRRLLPLLYAVNYVRVRLGLSLWVPNWIVTVKVVTHAA